MAWWFLDCFAFLHNWGWFIRHSAARRRSSGLFCVKRSICELISAGCQSCLLPIKSSASIMEPYKFGDGFPSVRQAYAAADGRLESIADVVMKVVMLCSSRVCSRMYFWRSWGAASQPLGFMTGNLISRRMEVFRVSDSIELGERKPQCGVQTQLTSILHPEYCPTL